MTIEQYQDRYYKELQEGYKEMLYDLGYGKLYVENTSDGRDEYVKDRYNEFKGVVKKAYEEEYTNINNWSAGISNDQILGGRDYK